MESESLEKSAKKISFSLDFNLGHLFVIFSLFLSAAGLYAHDESRVSVLETQVHALDSANLNGRMSTNEAKILGLSERLDSIHDVLLEIRNELALNHAATISMVKKVENKADVVELKTKAVESQAKQNSNAIKSRIFP